MFRVRRRQVSAGILALLSVMSPGVRAAPQAEILDYGYYQFTGESERLANPNVTTGYVARGEAELVEKTQRIPIKRGRLFGFRFRIDGMNKNVGVIPLQLIVEHPKMNRPDGSTSTGYSYQVDLKLKDGKVEDKTGYRLNEPFELVEGDWRFVYKFMNKVLMEQKFTTFLPEKVMPEKDMSKENPEDRIETESQS